MELPRARLHGQPLGRSATSDATSLVGPRDYYADAALIKDILITERVKAQFQFRAFNVFNHAALDIPDGVECTLHRLLDGWCDYEPRRKLEHAPAAICRSPDLLTQHEAEQGLSYGSSCFLFQDVEGIS